VIVYYTRLITCSSATPHFHERLPTALAELYGHAARRGFSPGAAVRQKKTVTITIIFPTNTIFSSECSLRTGLILNFFFKSCSRFFLKKPSKFFPSEPLREVSPPGYATHRASKPATNRNCFDHASQYRVEYKSANFAESSLKGEVGARGEGRRNTQQHLVRRPESQSPRDYAKVDQKCQSTTHQHFRSALGVGPNSLSPPPSPSAGCRHPARGGERVESAVS